MSPCSSPARVCAPRRAFTLTELLIALAIVALMATTLAALTQAVRVSNDFNDGVATATQHARVALERVHRSVRGAFANESFPGAQVFSDTIGSYSYPDTLVVWDPPSAPANPFGLPKFNEIVVFCPNPSAPTQLLEITAPTDTRSVPLASDLATWATELASLKTGNTSTKVLLTDLLRTAKPSSGTTDRGVLQFVVELRPSAAEWADYRGGSTAFDALPWVQSVYGSQTGLRQTWVRSELQLASGYNTASNLSRQAPLGFFGSASLYWNLHP